MNAYVTEPFIVYGLQCLISDPIMEDLLPAGKKKKPQIEEEEPINHLLHTYEARSAWQEYKESTNHSNAYFAHQKERVKNFVNDINKKTILFKSKIESLNTLKKHSVPDMSDDFKLTEDALMEEIIMQDQPYSSVMKTSHVSLVMKGLPRLAKTERSSAVPYKYPMNTGVKLGLLKVKSNPNLRKSNKKAFKPEVKESKWFEDLVKGDTENKLIHNIVDQWYKETGHKISSEQELDMEAIRQRIKHEHSLKNEEKLKGNALFNSMFRLKIDDSIKKRTEEQKEIMSSEVVRESKETGRNLKLLKSVEEASSLNLLLPDIQSARNSKTTLKKSSKGNSKKVFMRQPNRFELEEARKNAENKEKLKRIAQSLKELNRNAKIQAREVLYSPTT
eukprot:TRINITY_DN2262_c0_g1_i1.p1 TRINITY_DN2262_c0_g1~~TRINITY_DN2262_c0_g1_i1.p1  ORF type:complete len:390 (-),score=122.01 TRINITY_DN2262_c0_g1_i1:77-1246(-)